MATKARSKRAVWKSRAFEPLPLLPQGTSGRFSVQVRQPLLSRDIPKRGEQLFHYVDYFGRRVPFSHPFNFLAERQSDGTDMTWMSSTPQEVRPLLPLVDWLPDDASVLMIGLGLGLFPRLLESAGKRLGQLVVVERSQDVIDLVWPHVGKSWSRAIYVEDADYALDTLEPWHGAFDLVFIDTWPEADYLYLPVAARLAQKAKAYHRRGGRVEAWLQREMTVCLHRELRDVYQLVPEFKAQPEKHTAFRELWPHFWPFMKWGIEEVRSEEELLGRIREEIRAFKAGLREGLYTST